MPNNFRVELYIILSFALSWFIKKHFNLSLKMYIGMSFLLLIMFFEKLW